MKKRFTEEQILDFFKQAEAGMPVKELCRQPYTDIGLQPYGMTSN